jgi:hypothetical protein
MFGLGKLGKMGRVGGVRTTLASILSKYAGSHHWDFGVSADKVAAGAIWHDTELSSLAAYPAHALFQDTAWLYAKTLLVRHMPANLQAQSGNYHTACCR